jgi:hypothetical protein
MDFQLVTGRPDNVDHLVFTATFAHNNIFYKAALAETISWEGHLTGDIPVNIMKRRLDGNIYSHFLSFTIRVLGGSNESTRFQKEPADNNRPN